MNTFNLHKEVLRSIPSDAPEWFGFEEEKRCIEDALVGSMRQRRPCGIILQGAWGAGKTHAAKYFSAKPFEYFSREGIAYGGITSIYLEGPKVGSPSFAQFFHRVFNAIGFRRLRLAMEQIMTSGQTDQFEETLYAECQDEDVLTVLRSIPTNELPARAVLLGKSTTKQRTQIGIIRDFKTEFEMSLLLRGLFLLLSWPSTAGGLPSRVLLWVDELENLIYMRESQIQQFSQHFRTFWDHSHNVTVVLSFSFSDPTESGTIDGVLTSALVERISDRIIFDYPDAGKTESYLVDLLEALSSANLREVEQRYPFTATGFEKLVGLATGQTPRTVNEAVLRIIQSAEANREAEGTERLIDEVEVERHFTSQMAESD
jgi:hypothetical protein